MSGRAPVDVRERELAFFGTVTASLSHQINNVLTILNELGGLLSDMTGQPAADDARRERLVRLAERIVGNVERGSEYIRLLNRFSHSVDRPVAELDGAEQLVLVAAISQRFAELRQVRLEVDAPAVPVVLRTSPFRLLHALFECVRLALSVEGTGVVRLSLERTGAGARIRVVGDQDPGAVGDDHQAELGLLAALCQDLGATSSFVTGPAGCIHEIAFETCVSGGDNGESS